MTRLLSGSESSSLKFLIATTLTFDIPSSDDSLLIAFVDTILFVQHKYSDMISSLFKNDRQYTECLDEVLLFLLIY